MYESVVTSSPFRLRRELSRTGFRAVIREDVYLKTNYLLPPLTEDKSGIREYIHLIKCVDKSKETINATQL
jgi:hypothetical protein